MTDINALNPRPFLIELLNHFIIVKLKWGLEYKGRLISSDKYMNLQLTDAVEIIEGKVTGSLGEILVRCNNVLYVRELTDEEEK